MSFLVDMSVIREAREGPRCDRHVAAWAAALDAWIARTARESGERVLTVDERTLPVVDALLAATAIVHDHVLVTRDVKDLDGTGVRTLNPFSR